MMVGRGNSDRATRSSRSDGEPFVGPIRAHLDLGLVRSKFEARPAIPYHHPWLLLSQIQDCETVERWRGIKRYSVSPVCYTPRRLLILRIPQSAKSF